MEANDSLNFHESHSSEHLNSSTNVTASNVYVNHAETAWHARRREWAGEISQKSDRPSREPSLSWSTTYDLLSSTEPFKLRIPLAPVTVCDPDVVVDPFGSMKLHLNLIQEITMV